MTATTVSLPAPPTATCGTCGKDFIPPAVASERGGGPDLCRTCAMLRIEAEEERYRRIYAQAFEGGKEAAKTPNVFDLITEALVAWSAETGLPPSRTDKWTRRRIARGAGSSPEMVSAFIRRPELLGPERAALLKWAKA